MPFFSPLSLSAGAFAVASALGLAGDAPRVPTVSAPTVAVLYCTGCLCDAERPDMPFAGTWVPSGRMGDRVTLRFLPQDPARRSASACGRASAG